MSKDKLVKIKTALISVSDKADLDTLTHYLDKNNTKIPNVKPMPAPLGLDKHPIIICPKSSVRIELPG